MMKKKKSIAVLTSAALLTSIATPIVIEAAVQSNVKIMNVKVQKAEKLQVTYMKANKTYTRIIEPSAPVKHQARLVNFQLEGKKYTFKMEKKFLNPNYVSYGRQVAKAKEALENEDLVTAQEATAAAERHLKLIKITYMSPNTYRNALETLENLNEQCKAFGAPEIEAITVSQNSSNELIISGQRLSQLTAQDITMDIATVTSATVNATGTLMTIKLNKNLLNLSASFPIYININNETKKFEVTNTAEITSIAIKPGTYDYNTANQRLTLVVNGQEKDIASLQALGYTVQFSSYNETGKILDTGLFVGNTATSVTGMLDNTITNNTNYQVSVTISKSGKTLTSNLATIYIRDTKNQANLRLDISSVSASKDDILYLNNASDVSVTYQLNYYNTSGAYTGIAKVTDYNIYSSNPAVVKVTTSGTSNIIATGLSAGTATIYVYDKDNSLKTSQIITVNASDVLTTQEEVNYYLTQNPTTAELNVNINGNLYLSSYYAQNLTVKGRINGVLTVNTPSAHVKNNATILGGVNIEDVSKASFVNAGSIQGNINITDKDGMTFSNDGTLYGTVLIHTSAPIILSGTNAYQATVMQNNSSIKKIGTAATISVAPNVVVGMVETGNIVFASQMVNSTILPIGFITVNDADRNVNPSTPDMVSISIAGISREITLVETGVNTGVFKNQATIDLSSLTTSNVTVSYVDTQTANGSAQTIQNTFAVSLPTPSAPTLITNHIQTIGGTGSITIVSPLNNYIYQYSTNGSNWLDIPVGQYTINGLLAGNYWIRVKAMNSTPAGNAAQITLMNPEPAAPTGLSGRNASTGQANGAITGFIQGITYEYSTNGINWNSAVVNNNEIKNLPAGTYYIRIAAKPGSFTPASAPTLVTIGISPS